jgi:shikimate dehydrogenase
LKITSQTSTLGLIGHPVKHSKSPTMMNAILSSLKLPYVYLAYDVAPQSLQQALDGMKALSFRGWNVTLPHKVAIMEHLDEIDIHAKEIGAVNTVVWQRGKYMGYNTDGAGYLHSLLEEIPLRLSEQQVLLLGAGGAARAVAYALATAGVSQITIANRTLQPAEALADDLKRFTTTTAVLLTDAQKEMMAATLVINATPVGMVPDINEIPISPEWLHENMVVSDLIYHPRKTTFLQLAQAKGARTHTGLGMLIHQAALAFTLWTGYEASIPFMRTTLQATWEKRCGGEGDVR